MRRGASQQQAEAFRQQAEANELLTIEEACTLLKRNKVQLNHYRSLGLDYYKKGKDGVWYRRGDIVAWLESGKVNRHSR